MNIPDFTRYAKDQRSQVVGQSIAMPLTMTGFSFIGIAVTAATIVEFGEPIWDPVALVARLLADLPILLVLAMVIVVDRADLDEHGGQRRLALERLLEPLAAADLVPHGRPDHGGDRDRSRSRGSSTRTSAPTSSRGSSATAACSPASSR